MPAGSTNNPTELTCASFFDIPPHLVSPHTHTNGFDSAKHPSVVDALDQDQKLSAALLEEAEVQVEPLSEPPPAPHPFFFPPAPSPSPPLVAASVPEPPIDISSSPAALFLGAFMSPKPEPASLPDDEGSVVGGYTLGPIVGFGSFSTIRKAFSASGGTVAIKIVRRSDLVRTGHAPVERKKLEHEEAVWSSLHHEHILPLFSTVHTPYADYFITPYCPAGSLYDILKRDGSPALPQDDAGMMFRQVVRGLRYLHEEAMFVHRDMKLENVLVDESGVCRIGDFGMSVKIGQVQADEDADDEQQQQPHDAGYNQVHRAFSLTLPKRPARVTSSLNPIARHHSARHRSVTSSAASQASYVHQPGSLPYAAPELLLPQTAELAAPHPSQDIWALGVMLYALLAGHLPFNDSFEPRLQMKILNGAFDLPKDIGRGAERILHGCLERNVSKRWNAAMVDEVAWGVGWGSAGDSATPEVEGEFCLDESAEVEATPYQEAVDAMMSEDEEDDWQNEERRPRPAMEAATRRSTSRVKRSLSRAPLSARPPRSMSRPALSRASSPPRTGSSSYLDPQSAECDSPTGMRSPSRYYDTDSRSRSASRPRGRRPNKSQSYFPSRSPSPSVVPTTPVDLGSHILARMYLEDHPEEPVTLGHPAPRGRGRRVMYSPPGFTDDSTEFNRSMSIGRGSRVDELDEEELEEAKGAATRMPPPMVSSIASRWSAAYGSGNGGGSSGSSDRSLSRDRSRERYHTPYHHHHHHHHNTPLGAGGRRALPAVPTTTPATATGKMFPVVTDGEATVRRSAMGRSGSAGSLQQLWGAEPSLQVTAASGMLGVLSGVTTPASKAPRSRSAVEIKSVSVEASS